MNKNLDYIKKKLSLLPMSPGCYLMKNTEGKVIYVGKARKLKNRVSSYFTGAHNYKTTKLVDHIWDFDYIVTGSEKEALLDEYFILKNALSDDEEKVRIYLATAYNMFGEDNEWRQERVKQYFSDDELLIGKQYWNFVCDDENGYNIIIDEYKMCSRYILDALERIKNAYFN